MFSFKSFVLVAIFSVGAEASLLRKLSFDLIGSYEPLTAVYDHNNIDKDVDAIWDLVGKGFFDKARDVYKRGSHSKPIAAVTLDAAANDLIPGDTVVTGKNADGQPIKAKITATVPAGTQSVKLQYDTRSAGSTCNVGGNPNPNFEGCFAPSGTLETENGLTLNYSYTPANGNTNSRTVQGFSLDADNRFKDRRNKEWYPDMAAAIEYYGTQFYADRWLIAAFDKTSTTFTNGNGDFTSYDDNSRAEIVKKGASYMSVAMYVIRELEDAVGDCLQGCDPNGDSDSSCNDDPVHALDEAVAFYTGSLEAEGDGVLMYNLAEKRCANFRTCGRAGDSPDMDDGAKVNYEIFPLFDKMQRELRASRCEAARNTKNKIVKKMTIPFIQGTIRYAYKTGVEPAGTQKMEAEGAAFAAAVLPWVNRCSPDAAQTIYDNMKTGQGNTADYRAVKKAFEGQYGCLGITCEDIGGLWDDTTSSYFKSAGPCGTSSSDINVGLAVVLPVAALAILGLGMCFFCRRRRAAAMEGKESEMTNYA